MADRSTAVAAVNAGFFLPTGEPAGLLKIRGELVSDVSSHRGAVALVAGRFGRGPRLLFDQVSARVEVDAGRGKDRRTIRADGIDTARGPDALVLFTPRFWTDTRTPCDGGTEFVIDGPPLAVADRREGLCTSAIPRDGAVLAAGPKVPAETDRRNHTWCEDPARAWSTTRSTARGPPIGTPRPTSSAAWACSKSAAGCWPIGNPRRRGPGSPPSGTRAP